MSQKERALVDTNSFNVKSPIDIESVGQTAVRGLFKLLRKNR